MTNFDHTIFAPFLPALKAQTAVMAHLTSQRVSAERFLVYQFDKELHKAEMAGYVITTMLILVIGSLGYASGQNTDVHPMWPGMFGGLLGLLIGWMSLRLLRGQHSRYVHHPDETSSGFLALGMVNKWTVKALKAIPDSEWERMRSHEPDITKKRYMRPGGRSTDKELSTLMKMTPAKFALVAKLKRVQRVAAWSILLAVISFFTDTDFFFFLGWFLAGVWIVLEMSIGFIERRIGAFTAASEVEILGLPARFTAAVLIPIFSLLFLLPGVLGMLNALGIDVW